MDCMRVATTIIKCQEGEYILQYDIQILFNGWKKKKHFLNSSSYFSLSPLLIALLTYHKNLMTHKHI